MKDKPLTVIWIFALFALAAIFFTQCHERQEFRRELAQAADKHLSQADIDFISRELKRLNCDDAIITSTSYGYLAREISTGKNFNEINRLDCF